MPGRKWLGQVRTCSSKTPRRYRMHCALAWKRRRRSWDGPPNNLVARSAYQEKGWKRQRNVPPATRKQYSTQVPPPPAMDGVSREYFQMVRHQVEKSMDRMNQLWTCRTPQELAAVQTD